MSSKIAILTNSHRSDDVRLHGKIGTSLAKIADVRIFAPIGLDDFDLNPSVSIIPNATKFTYLQNAYHLIKSYKPDIIVCVEPLTLIVGQKLKREIGCKLVYDVHEYFSLAMGERLFSPFKQLANFLYSRIEKKLFSKTDLVITVNNHLRKYYRRYSLDTITCANYPHLKGCEQHEGKKQYDIVYVGGVYQERGILKILKAISILKNKHPDFKAVIAGEFKNRDFQNKYEKTIIDLNLTKHVLFMGMLPHCQVYDLLVKSRIGICLLDPRIKRYQLGVPIKVIEYLEAGLPIIANDFQQIRDIIEHQELGYCIPYNSRVLSDKIDLLLQKNDDYFLQTAMKSRELVRTELNWETQEPLLLTKIQSLMPILTNQKHMLLFAYFYPPLGGSGVQRPVKLTKYLWNEGWDTDVITVKNIVFHSEDESLLQESRATHVYRTSSLDPMALMKKATISKESNQKIYFGTPEKIKRFIRRSFPIDDKIGWIPFAYLAGVKATSMRHYDAILVTVGPYSAAIAAYRLAKLRQIPLFMDYRDPWTLYHYLTYISKLHFRHAHSWEKKLLNYSTGITVISEGMKNDLCKNFGDHLADKIHVMFNGWDETDFTDLVKKEPSKIIRMSYIGSLYGNRTAKYLLQAMRELKQNHALPSDLEITFLGNYYAEEQNVLLQSRLGSQLKIITQQQHREALDLMYNSDILVLIVASVDGDYISTGKIFEYVRCQSIILGLVPPNGDAAMILRKFGHSLICPMEDVQKIKELILEAYQKATLKAGEGMLFQEYSREEQTKKFIKFVENRLGQHS